MNPEKIKCKEFSNLLDQWQEGCLPDAEMARMRRHAAECLSCAEQWVALADLHRLQENAEVPDAFHAAWRTRIKEENLEMNETKENQHELSRTERENDEKENRKLKKKKNWKSYLAAAAALVFVLGGTAKMRDYFPARTVSKDVDSGYYSEPSYSAPSAFYAMEDSAAMDGSSRMYSSNGYAPTDTYAAEEATSVEQIEKIIRTASFTVKTTEFEKTLSMLQSLTEECGGRVQYLSRKGDAQNGEIRSATLTLRIPAERLDTFLEGSGQVGTMTSLVQESKDVSDSYYDIKTRLQTQQTKLERLQKLMQEADQVSDMIEIESAIAETQYLIDSYNAQLNDMDSKVNFSTVDVSVRETRVSETKEVSLLERLGDALQGSLEEGKLFLQDVLIFLVSALPWLAGIAVVVLAIRLIAKKRKGKKNQ